MLKKEMGEHLWYTAMPHFFSGGCQDEITIRSAVEVNAWACNTFGRERVYLKNTFEAANEILCENGDGGRQAPVAVRYRLPGGLSGGAPPAVWMSGGVVSLPRAVKPAQLVQERYLYRTLVAELRGGLAFGTVLYRKSIMITPTCTVQAKYTCLSNSLSTAVSS
jgi:hypothetical protein